jgi:hypothetical protein
LEVIVMAALLEYRWSDNALFRWKDHPAGLLEIYRGGGVWEPWNDPYDWIYGSVVSDKGNLDSIIKSIDAGPPKAVTA